MGRMRQGLTKEQISNLRLLSKVLTDQTVILSAHQAALLKQFLASCIDARAINNSLMSSKRQLAERDIDQRAIDMVIDISFSTRRLNELDEALKTFSNQENKDENVLELLRKFAVIDRLANLAHHFAVLERLNLVKTHPALVNLQQKIKQCHHLVELCKQYEHRFAAHQPGLYLRSPGSAHGQSLAFFKQFSVFLTHIQTNIIRPPRP